MTPTSRSGVDVRSGVNVLATVAPQRTDQAWTWSRLGLAPSRQKG
jgi:hypothetical protein